MEKWELQIYGKVQGVGFRYSVVNFIHTNMPFFKSDTGITGRVKNISNGSVLVIAVGEKNDLECLADFVAVGPPSSSVDNVKIEKTKIDSAPFNDFTIEL